MSDINRELEKQFTGRLQQIEDRLADQRHHFDLKLFETIGRPLAQAILKHDWKSRSDDKENTVEIVRGDDVLYRGKSGQTPEIDKLSAGDYEYLNRVMRLPTDSELENPGEDLSVAVRIDDELVFAAKNDKVMVNGLLSDEQVSLLDTADQILDTQGTRSFPGEISYSGKYSVSKGASGLRIHDPDGRVVVDTESGVFEATSVDFEAFTAARQQLEDLEYQKRPGLEYER